MLFVIFLCGLIVFTGAIKTQVSLSYPLETQTEKRLILSYSPHEPITITNDDNFTDYLFPGSGTAGEPYIIENYNITTTSNKGIHIYNTTKYFIIRNCYVVANQFCICLSHVAEGTMSIINNICSGSSFYGIHLRYSTGATLTNNTSNNHTIGISLYFSPYASLMNNSCSNNAVGINLFTSSCATLTKNVFNNNSVGIQLEGSFGATLTDNVFFNDGLYIMEETVEDYLSYIVENNWVNNKPLGFYINLNKITISEPVYGQLIFINCNKTAISNQELSNVYIGIYLKWCENTKLTNNFCNDNHKGIHLDFSSDVILNENTCNNNLYHGIRLVSSPDATLTDNICTNNFYGIAPSLSDGATLTDNICNDNGVTGISLTTCPGSTLTNNICNNNQVSGISLSSSSNTTSTQNTCKNNRWGIRLSGSDCLLTYNLLQENEEHGIFIHSSSYRNTIHRNSFIDNNPGGTSQAYDEGENNTWYDVKKKKGNYWSDWNQSGSYFIDGRADSIDPYPLDKIPKRIDYNFMIIIPSISLLTILLRNSKKKKSRKFF